VILQKQLLQFTQLFPNVDCSSLRVLYNTSQLLAYIFVVGMILIAFCTKTYSGRSIYQFYHTNFSNWL